MKATFSDYDSLMMTLAVWSGQYNNPSAARDRKERDFKSIIKEADTKEFYIFLTDGGTTTLRLFISTDQDVCFFAKGKRTRGYRLNLDKVERIEAKMKKEQSKFRTFHRNCEKAASMLQASGFWPNFRKRMAVMAAMSEQDYNKLMDIYESYWKVYDQKNLTYAEQESKQQTIRQEFDAYFTERGAESDFYHFKQLCENGQVVAVPYSNGGYNKAQQLQYANTIIEQVRNGEVDKYKTFYWYGGYDYHIEVRKNEDGSLYAWYSAEYKGCGNGHYYILLDAEHALYLEDD